MTPVKKKAVQPTTGIRRIDLCLKMLTFRVILLIIGSLILPIITTPTTAPESGQFSTADIIKATELPEISFCDVKASNGTPCTLLQTDGIIEVNYRSPVEGMTVSLMSYMPNYLTVEGNCQGEGSSNMRIVWSTYSLHWQLNKTSDQKYWYVSFVELTVHVENEFFRDLKMVGKTFKLVNKQVLFFTPVGKCFSCEDSVIELESPDADLYKQGLCGSVFLRAFQLQPCAHKGDSFGPSHKCRR